MGRRMPPLISSSLMTLKMSSHGSLVDRAVAAAEEGNFQAAAEAFAAAIRLHQDDATLYEQHAQCLMELEQYDAAVEAAERATALKPSWPEAWLTLARSLLNIGELQCAQQACSKCLELDPKYPEALEDMAGIADLLARQTGHVVGLPGLTVVTDPGGQTGPGLVVWEAGVQLARLLLHLAAMQQQAAGAQQPCDGAHDLDTAGAAATCHSCQQRPAVRATHHPAQQAHAVSQATVDMAQLPALKGACVLELGAGTGVVGLTAAACGAHVTLTDLPAVQPLLQSNIARNQQLVEVAGGSASAAVLDWGIQQAAQPARACALSRNEQDRPDCSRCHSANQQAVHRIDVEGGTGSQLLSDPKWEWGFGADLVFNASQVEPVVQAIRCFLQTRDAGSQCQRCFLLSHKQRHADVDQQLLQAFNEAGCSVSRVVLPDEHPCEGGHVCIWRIQPVTCNTCRHCSLRWLGVGTVHSRCMPATLVDTMPSASISLLGLVFSWADVCGKVLAGGTNARVANLPAKQLHFDNSCELWAFYIRVSE